MENIGKNTYCLDLQENGNQLRTSSYLIQAEKTVLIETGASPSVNTILQELDQAGITPESVDAVAVTHIHLDHSGGAGLLMEKLPNAVLLSPPKGVKHLVNPEKLIASAKGVYGELFDKFFDPILPIPAERVISMEDGAQFDLGEDRKLVFYDGHGHAFHHSILLDTRSKYVFTGDAAGVHFRGLFEEYGKDLSLPITSPTQFEPAIMKETIKKIKALKPAGLCLTHYGFIQNTEDHLNHISSLIDTFTLDLTDKLGMKPEHHEIVDFMNQLLHQWYEENQVPAENTHSQIIAQDIEVNAQGIYHYLQSQ